MNTINHNGQKTTPIQYARKYKIWQPLNSLYIALDIYELLGIQQIKMLNSIFVNSLDASNPIPGDVWIQLHQQGCFYNDQYQDHNI